MGSGPADGFHRLVDQQQRELAALSAAQQAEADREPQRRRAAEAVDAARLAAPAGRALEF